MVQCFLVESDSLLLFLLFFLSAIQMMYTKKKKITMAINTDAANMQKSNK